MESLHNTFRIKLSLVPMDYFRSFHEQINWKSRLICIMGQKGIGKSTMILQHIKKYENLEISDFEINGITFEVGGKNKNGTQIKDAPTGYLVKDNLEYAFGNSIPIWMFGFLY